MRHMESERSICQGWHLIPDVTSFLLLFFLFSLMSIRYLIAGFWLLHLQQPCFPFNRYC